MGISIDQQTERIRARLMVSAEVARKTSEACLDSIIVAAEIISASFRAGGKLLLCGNGGSAADCQHFATELVSIMEQKFHRPGLPAIALTTDTSFLTAFSNDFGYEGVFERQVQAHGKHGDVLIGISTSGNSASILRAVEAAKGLGMKTIALTGNSGRLASITDVAIAIPSSDNQQIQEVHLIVEHSICDLVECHLFSKAEFPGGQS
jgi:phosphoheptose isomerase